MTKSSRATEHEKRQSKIMRLKSRKKRRKLFKQSQEHTPFGIKWKK